MITIKHQIASVQQKFNLLSKCDLLKFFNFSTIDEFDKLYKQNPQILLKVRKYLPLILESDPAIKQLQKISNRSLLYQIIKIYRPTVDENSSESLYYRLVVNG